MYLFLSFMFHVCLCYAVLSVPSITSGPVITCKERADLLALLCVMFSCVFVTFPYGVSGQVWYLTVSISDRCLPLYIDWSLVRTSLEVLCCVLEKVTLSSPISTGSIQE